MNIVLLILDTARGDVVNQLIEEEELPSLCELSKSGTRFMHARANGPWTVPSHGAIFTGKYPSESGVNGADPNYYSVPLIEELRQRGYQTAAFSANPWLSKDFGFDEPFDEFYDEFTYDEDGASVRKLFGIREHPTQSLAEYFAEARRKRFVPTIQNLGHWVAQAYRRKDTGGRYLLSRAGDWLEENDKRFAFINVTEPHLQYHIPDEWFPKGVNQETLASVQQDTAAHNAGVQRVSDQDLAILRKTYRSTIRYIDDRIGALIDRASDETVFIVAGDHGEHFGEHDRFGHQYSLHDELLHVPLIISGPNLDHGIINEPVELKSLHEFIRTLADGEVNLPDPVDYHLAEVISPTPTVKMLEEKGSGDLPEYVRRYGEGARCVAGDEGTLVEFPDGETELLSGSAEEVKSLQRILHDGWGEFSTVDRTEMNVSDSIEEQLGDLGYL